MALDWFQYHHVWVTEKETEKENNYLKDLSYKCTPASFYGNTR